MTNKDEKQMITQATPRAQEMQPTHAAGGEAKHTPTPRPASANFMTFGDLLDRHHRSHSGTCRFCKAYAVEGMYYSTRAMVCVECAQKRRDETLPSVVKAEAKALRMASEHLRNTAREPWKPWMVRQISGVNKEFAEWACAQVGVR